MTDRRPGGPDDGLDDDIWTTAEPAPARGPAQPPRRPRGPRPPEVAPGRADAPPTRTGPARPPRRGGPRQRPAEPTGRPAGPGRGADHASGPVATRPAPTAIAGGPVVDDDGYEYVDLPPEGRFPKWLGVLLVLLLVVGAAVGGGLYWYDRQLNPPGSPGETVTVEVPQGASTSGIGSILESEGVIPNSMVFNFYASRKDAGPFEAGVYRLRRNSDVDLVLATLAKGPTSGPTSSKTVKVAIPEGLTVTELVAKIADQQPRLTAAKLQAALDGGAVPTTLRPDGQASYEGLLFPATYDVGEDTTEVDLLSKLAGEMETRVSGLDADAAKARIKSRFGVDVSTYQLLTVASLVQAEAGNAEEAPKIATVIYNRLAEDSTALTLGIDAVDDYGAQLVDMDVAAYRQTDQPYNTRKVKGLPPTPISAPGDYALRAAFEPAEGPWLYYVLSDPGVHTFVVTDAEFVQAKQVCEQKGLGCG